MTIKQHGGIFGRNPTFNDVTVDGSLTLNGEVFTDLGTMATQDANNVNIDGGAIDGTTLGATGQNLAHSFRTASSTGTSGGGGDFWKIGTWSGVGGGSRLALRVVGAAGFSAFTNTAGESVIYLTRNNAGENSGFDLEGSFYSLTSGAGPAVVSVYWVFVSSGVYDVYIRTASFTNIDPIGFANQSNWTTAVSSTGSATIPTGGVNVPTQTMKFFVGAQGNGTASTPFITANSAGDVAVGGALSKASGSFKISHPLPEKNSSHFLVHSFVEAPFADLIYSGMATLSNGSVSIDIDEAAGMSSGTFELLCTNVRRFCSNESGYSSIKSSFSGSILTITSEDPSCNDEVFWQIIGERKDQHMLETGWTDENGRVIVEPEKVDGLEGTIEQQAAYAAAQQEAE